MSNFKAKYSGEGKSGICICGCPWNSHHLSMIFNKQYLEETKEGYVVGQCCRYGFNETEGMKYNENTDEWEHHCSGYRDAGVN